LVPNPGILTQIASHDADLYMQANNLSYLSLQSSTSSL
jgi:hypothetical protein